MRHCTSSLIIQELRNDSKFAFASFYFNRLLPNGDGHNNRRALIRSLLFQIVDRRSSPAHWDYLRKQFPEVQTPPTPSYEKLVEMLFYILRDSGPTVIAIDALDECQSRDPSDDALGPMLDFLRDLHQLKPPLQSLHVLVTSRPEKRILHCLEGLDTSRPRLDLRNDRRHLQDVKDYIAYRLSDPTVADAWDSDQATRDTVKKALLEKSEGM